MSGMTRRRLDHVLWMGGAPCSGKSSMAEMLAGEYALRIYHCDEALPDHLSRITAKAQPTLRKWTNTAWDALWMQPLDTLVAEAIAAYREHFGLVVEDLLAQPGSQPVLVEGTCLLPDCVHTLLPSRRRAAWVVPTEEFQRTHYPRRGAWVQGILDQCRDPEAAFRNWMDRDVEFARWVVGRTNELGLKLVKVDGSRTIANNAKRVAAHFRLA